MAKRRYTRNKKKNSRRLLWFLLLVAAALIGYTPLTEALKRADLLPAQVAQLLDQTLKNTGNDPQTVTTPADLEGLELPAPLKGKDEIILKRKGYTVSYNRKLNLPNWVAWELNRDKLVERESRTDKFLPDPDLPPAEAVTTDDYKGSGWDRGHMCPAADNRWHWRAMQESFYMTNICPQHHNLNRGDWKELEDRCRVWAEQEGRIYIVCGPILYNQKHRTIGKEHKIVVPEAFFKVILCADSRVERITGIDFFPALPDDVEKRVEATYNWKEWN